MKRLFLICHLLALLILSTNSTAQLPSIIPPSPEASAIGKYIDTPVNYYSGLPSIDIPLFEAKSGDLMVPVSLSYHLGGIRVGEVSSRIGLGWNLGAGGMITRSVKGIPDDLNNGFFKTNETVADLLAAEPLDKQVLVNQALSQQNDYEPDVFMVSMPGFSGKFIFDQDGNILPIENTDYKYEYVDSGWRGITQFIVTDNVGNKFFFGAYGSNTARDSTAYTQSYVESSNPGGIPNSINYSLYYNSWHLMAIESSKDDSKILFDYEFRTTKGLDFGEQYKVTANSPVDCPVTEGIFTSYHLNELYEALISKIIFENDTITFIYDATGRLDKTGDNALVEVKHSNGFKYTLEQDYNISFDESSTVVPIGTQNKSVLTHRLMLRNIKRWDETGTNSLAHTFDYHERNGMPNRLSYAQDMWGFYNGATGNTTAIPQYLEPNYAVTPTNTYMYQVPGADRRTNSDYSNSLSLSSITYPTGGKKVFQTESNGAYRAGIDTQLHNSFFELEDDDLVNFSYTNGQSQTFTQNFTVTSDHIDQVLHFSYDVAGCGPDPGEPGGISYCGLEVSITGINVTYSKSLSLGNDVYFKVPEGTYELEIEVIDNVPENEIVSTASATLKAFNNASPYAAYDEYEVGGLRLKSVLAYDAGDLNPILKRDYSYLRSDSLTSGLLSAQKWSFYNDAVECIQMPHVGRVITSQSLLPFLGTGASHISYTSVREYIAKNTGIETYANGYNHYTYEYTYDLPNTYSDTYPFFTPFKQTPWRRGKLKQNEVYQKDLAGSSFSLKEKNVSDYIHTTILDSLNPPYAYPTYREIDAVKVSTTAMSQNVGAEYKILTGGSQMIKSTRTVYEGNNEVKTEVSYGFDRSFYRPNEITEIDSQNDTIKTEILYAEDHNLIQGLSPSERSVVIDMKAANMINLPISTKKTVNGVTISQDLTRYASQIGGKYVPEAFERWDAILDSYYEVGSISYDPQQRPIEMERSDGTVVSYLWGYGDVPIVKAENATYQQLTNIVSVVSAGQEQSDASLRTLLLPLQAALPDAQISIYTYKKSIGISSVTDPNGRTSTYEYDSFGRLSKVLDHEGNILKRIEYTYKNN